MSKRWQPSRLLSVVAGVSFALAGALVAPLAHPQAAHASVTAGDLIYERLQLGANYPNEIARKSGSTITTVSTTSDGDNSPDVCSDGSRIAFASPQPMTDDFSRSAAALMVSNSDGSARTILARAHSSPFIQFSTPRWSPDCSMIAYVRNESNSSYIAVMNADGSAGSTIVGPLNGGGAVYAPTWSPTKTSGHYRIAYESETGSGGNGQTFVVRDDGANAASLTTADTGHNDLVPTWSPDGSRIYLLSDSKLSYYTTSDGFATQVTSANRHELSSTLLPSYEQRFGISSDSSTLVYSAPDGSGCAQIWSISSSGGSATNITDNGCSYHNYAPTFVYASWPNASTKNLVALGDSVAAGEGINYDWEWDGVNEKWVHNGPSLPSWQDTTYQSGLAYADLFFLHGENYHVYNMSCTGASAGNGMFYDQTIGAQTIPAQLSSASGNQLDAHQPDIDASLDVDLVNISGMVSGHEFCTSDPWVYGPSIDYPPIGGGPGNSPAPFHLTPAGERELHEAVKAALP
jgi:Tol biopolymer transport system component